jgi:hypothetical protein
MQPGAAVLLHPAPVMLFGPIGHPGVAHQQGVNLRGRIGVKALPRVRVIGLCADPKQASLGIPKNTVDALAQALARQGGPDLQVVHEQAVGQVRRHFVHALLGQQQLLQVLPGPCLQCAGPQRLPVCGWQLPQEGQPQSQ